ncbi:MAG: lysylphosphatidylglycerol synthase transmembrane domain-containing protein [Candidatus Firestonebacteria bacterium]
MKKSYIKILVGFIIGLLSFIAWSKFVDLNTTLNNFKTIKIFPAILGGGFFILSFIFKTLRWGKILLPIKKIKFSDLFKSYMCGIYINWVMPLKFGEVVQTYVLKKNNSISILQSFPTVFIDRIFSLGSTLVVFLILPFLPFRFHPYLRWGLVVMIAVFFFLMLFILMREKSKGKILKTVDSLLFFLPNTTIGKINSIVSTFVDGLAVIEKQYENLPTIILISFSILIAEGLAVFYLAKSMSFDIPFLIAVVGIIMYNLFYILPTPPGSLGTAEWYLSIIFIFGFSLSKELLPGIILFHHIVTGLIIVLIGTYATVSSGLKFMLFTDINTFKNDSLVEKGKP